MHRPDAAPHLLRLRTHSRRDGISSSSRALGGAADVSQDPWRESHHACAYAHLLSDLFHEGPGDGAAVLSGDRIVAMILLAGSPGIDQGGQRILHYALITFGKCATDDSARGGAGSSCVHERECEYGESDVPKM